MLSHDSCTHTHTHTHRETHLCDDMQLRNKTLECHNHTLAAGRRQLPVCVRLQSMLGAHVAAITTCWVCADTRACVVWLFGLPRYAAALSSQPHLQTTCWAPAAHHRKTLESCLSSCPMVRASLIQALLSFTQRTTSIPLVVHVRLHQADIIFSCISGSCKGRISMQTKACM